MSADPGICAAAPRSCAGRCQHASRSCRAHRQTRCLAAAVAAAVTIGTAAVAAAAFEAAAAYDFGKGASHAGAFHSSDLLQWMQNLNLAPIHVEVVGPSNGLSSPRGCPWLTQPSHKSVAVFGSIGMHHSVGHEPINVLGKHGVWWNYTQVGPRMTVSGVVFIIAAATLAPAPYDGGTATAQPVCQSHYNGMQAECTIHTASYSCRSAACMHAQCMWLCYKSCQTLCAAALVCRDSRSPSLAQSSAVIIMCVLSTLWM